MNANELADKLQNEKANTLLYVATVADSANMLRQQQAEIEALKAKDLKKSMAIRSLNTQLKKALQYETYSR